MQKTEPRAERGGATAVVPAMASNTAPAESDEIRRARARAHRNAVAKFSKNVEQLVTLVGAPLVAYLADVAETRSVKQWIVGEHAPNPRVQSKLQLALMIATFLHEQGEDGAIEAWFQGLNPALDDHAPAELLREATADDFTKIGRQVLAAAREFVNK